MDTPGNDAALGTQGIRIPGADVAASVAPDAVAPALETPDITKAQLVGAVPIVAQLLAAFHIITITAVQEAALEKAIGGAVGLMLADAIIRFGRARGLR